MKDSQGDPRRGLSRRGFLTGTGAAAAAVAGLTAELRTSRLPRSPPARAAFGPAPVLLELTVNGKNVTTNVEPRVTLLDALRNYLDVTGCKRVCDRGTCGACTVMLDGRTVYSCTMLALEARGTEIKTAESLGGGQARRGPGRVRRQRRPAVRLLHAGLRRLDAGRPRQEPERHARASRSGPLRQHLPLRHLRADAARHRSTLQEGGLSHGKGRRLARRIAASSAPRSSASTARRRPPATRSTATTSTGRGMLHGTILRSPHAHAKIKSIDTTAARKVPGFKALLVIGVARNGTVDADRRQQTDLHGRRGEEEGSEGREDHGGR